MMRMRLAATVTYDATLRQVDISRYDANLSLVTAKSGATVNGSVVAIDPADTHVVPVIATGRTMLPLRFVVESLGTIVICNAVSRVIAIV